MSFWQNIASLFDKNYETQYPIGLYKLPDGELLVQIPANTVVEKLAGAMSEAWWVVSLTLSDKSYKGFVEQKYLSTFTHHDTQQTPIVTDKLAFSKVFLQRFAPRCTHIDALFLACEKLFSKYEVNSTLRISHFLAQIYVESASFTRLEENLHYSASRLCEIFPTRFHKIDAERYANNPQQIANRAYANKIGNGNEASGDGYKYRGRGYIQLTGKANYVEIGAKMKQDIAENPDLLLQPHFALQASLAYWQTRNLNSIADWGSVRDVTKKINAACLHLSEREAAFRRAMSLLI